MNDYRIYAKIIGPSLPDKVIPYEECFLAPMSIEEQKRRRFKTVEASWPMWVDENYYKTYVTHRIDTDPRIIKSNHVIYTDIKTHDASSAMGHAIKRFEKMTGVLTVASSVHYAKKYNVKSRYTNYEYQIVRIYELVEGKESDAEVPVIVGGMMSHPNLPSNSDMNALDEKFIERMLKSKDDIFWKSLGYLQSGGKGIHANESPEKMTLDLMKSIELIINIWEGKSFPTRLKKATKELGIDEEDCEKIKELWRLRSNGDIAHAKRGSRANFYPAQYPVPSNVDGPYIDSPSLAARILTKYFLFRDSIISIKISKEPYDDIDELIDVNRGAAYVIRPSNMNKRHLTPFLKRKISTHFKVPMKNIKLYGYQLPFIHFRIADHLAFNLSGNNIKKKRLVLLGSI